MNVISNLPNFHLEYFSTFFLIYEGPVSMLLRCLLGPWASCFYKMEVQNNLIGVYHSFIEFQKGLSKSDNFYSQHIPVAYKCLLWDEFELTKNYESLLGSFS